MGGIVLSAISSPPATSTSAMNEPTTEGGERGVLGAFFSLLGVSNGEGWGAGRERKQGDCLASHRTRPRVWGRTIYSA